MRFQQKGTVRTEVITISVDQLRLMGERPNICVPTETFSRITNNDFREFFGNFNKNGLCFPDLVLMRFLLSSDGVGRSFQELICEECGARGDVLSGEVAHENRSGTVADQIGDSLTHLTSKPVPIGFCGKVPDTADYRRKMLSANFEPE